MTPKENVKLIITGRAIIINKDKKLLLVKNKGENIWFTPGGWLTGFETLEEACAREVYEELGIRISPKKLFKIDYFRLTAKQNTKWKEAINKIEHYFLCDVNKGEIRSDANNNNLWIDHDSGNTQFVKYFNKAELSENNIAPLWLSSLIK